MEASKTKLHPLLTVAAISLTVFSAVGVAALTGLVPMTHSSTRPSEQPPLVSSLQAAPAPLAQAPETTPSMPAAPAASPAPKPRAKPVVKQAAQSPSAPVVYRDYDDRQVVAQAPAPAAIPAPVQMPSQVEAPKPVVQAGILGRVENVREVAQKGQHTAMGPVAGAVLGNQFGEGLGKKIFTVVGAAGGAFAGREIEKRARATKSWEIDVRLDDGSTRTIPSGSAPVWHAGDRIRLLDGKLQPV